MWTTCARCQRVSSEPSADWWGRCPRCGEMPATTNTSRPADQTDEPKEGDQ